VVIFRTFDLCCFSNSITELDSVQGIIQARSVKFDNPTSIFHPKLYFYELFPSYNFICTFRKGYGGIVKNKPIDNLSQSFNLKITTHKEYLSMHKSTGINFGIGSICQFNICSIKSISGTPFIEGFKWVAGISAKILIR
jgi:hypothetical protein